MIDYIILLAIAIIVGLAYGLPGLFADWLKNGSKIDYAKLGATIVYSIVVGVIAVQTGILSFETLPNWQTLLTPVWATYLGLYTFLLYVFQKVAVPVVQQLLTTYKRYPTTRIAKVDPARKMDAETRGTFFDDNPAKQQILDCVDQAEAKQTYRYAIAAGAWEYLVEYGEVTGAKHYTYKFWGGISAAEWKPISVECLENIRKTGKFPAYNDLY